MRGRAPGRMPRRPRRVERLAPPTPRPPGRARRQRRPARFGSVVVRSSSGARAPVPPPRAADAPSSRRCVAPAAYHASAPHSAARTESGRWTTPITTGCRSARSASHGGGPVEARELDAGLPAEDIGEARRRHDRSPPRPARGRRERVGSCPGRRRGEPPPRTSTRRGLSAVVTNPTKSASAATAARTPASSRSPHVFTRTRAGCGGTATERSATAWMPAPPGARLGRRRRGARSR